MSRAAGVCHSASTGVRTLRRLDGADAAAASALAVITIAYVGHALIDYDWDFVGVTAPLFLVLGVLLATGRVARVAPMGDDIDEARAMAGLATVRTMLGLPAVPRTSP